MTQEFEADYVIVGAGATALAFADTMLSESDASMIIVDRRDAPGGHWNACYPFVRLHGPSLNYGVNSRELGTEETDEEGFNAGLHQLAAGPDIRAYFHAVMAERLLPSGRVRYLPSHEYADGVATGPNGAIRLSARRKLVDATYTGTQLPNEQPPPFTIAPGVRCIPPHALERADATARYVIIGAGKTAMDTVVWLITNGAAPEHITWIRPRDAWILSRETVQPSYAFFAATYNALVAEIEAARDAENAADLYLRLEQAGLWRRLDPAVMPDMYRCAIASAGEVALLRQVTNVVRKGRVKAIDRARIALDAGEIETPPDALYINCSADGIPRQPPRPVFANDRITLQYVRRCSPTFSAAFIAFLEATMSDNDAKNALSAPVPIPDAPIDWISSRLAEARNRYLWQKSPGVLEWVARSRLDRFSAMAARAISENDPAHTSILARYSAAMKPGLANLTRLLEAA